MDLSLTEWSKNYQNYDGFLKWLKEHLIDLVSEQQGLYVPRAQANMDNVGGYKNRIGFLAEEKQRIETEIQAEEKLQSSLQKAYEWTKLRTKLKQSEYNLYKNYRKRSKADTATWVSYENSLTNGYDARTNLLNQSCLTTNRCIFCLILVAPLDRVKINLPKYTFRHLHPERYHPQDDFKQYRPFVGELPIEQLIDKCRRTDISFTFLRLDHSTWVTTKTNLGLSPYFSVVDVPSIGAENKQLLRQDFDNLKGGLIIPVCHKDILNPKLRHHVNETIKDTFKYLSNCNALNNKYGELYHVNISQRQEFEKYLSSMIRYLLPSPNDYFNYLGFT